MTHPGVRYSLKPSAVARPGSGPPGPSPVTCPRGLVPPQWPVLGSVIPGRSPRPSEVGPCPRSGPRGSGPGLGLPGESGAAGLSRRGCRGRGPGFRLSGPDTGRGHGLWSGRHGPGQAGRGLTDLPSQLRASWAHAGPARAGGGAAPSRSPQEQEKKARPEFKTKRRKCPSGADRRVRAPRLGMRIARPGSTRRPGQGRGLEGAVRGVARAEPEGAGASGLEHLGPEEARVAAEPRTGAW